MADAGAGAAGAEGDAVAPREVAHHDASRAAVSTTALGACALRALESQKPPAERLIHDPFAAVVCGDAITELPLMKEVGQKKDFWLDFMAVRSRWIDEQMPDTAQLVILGAGLDTRAYRLEVLKDVPVYEVDFKEVLDAKAELLKSHMPIARLSSVCANLSTELWAPQLEAAGFRPTAPATFLLEGLTGYLTEPEVHALLAKVSQLACAGSRMTATFVGADMKENTTSMHRFLVSGAEEIRALLGRFGWRATVAQPLGQLAIQYRRNQHMPEDYAYFMVSAVRE